MKKTLYILLAFITITLCSSCDWLEPEQDPSTQMYHTAAMLISNPSLGQYTFLADDSVQLIPSTPLTIPDAQKDTLLNKRYYITFQIEIETQSTQSYNINLISMQMMNKESIININNNDTINKYKNEQLNINLLWCSGKYLNIITQVKGSGSVAHNYYLLHNPNIDSDTLDLTMRYNSNNDKPTYALQQAMYYDLTEYITGKSDSTTICFNYNSGTPTIDTLYLKIANK
jgi:hypothetical protein